MPFYFIFIFLEIELLDFNDTSFSFRCVVSKGTYIRSLIRDIGVKLGVLACMSDLVRTRQGKFRLEDSYTLADIKNGTYDFLTISDVFDNVKQVVLEDELLHVTLGPKEYCEKMDEMERIVSIEKASVDVNINCQKQKSVSDQEKSQPEEKSQLEEEIAKVLEMDRRNLEVTLQ